MTYLIFSAWKFFWFIWCFPFFAPFHGCSPTSVLQGKTSRALNHSCLGKQLLLPSPPLPHTPRNLTGFTLVMVLKPFKYVSVQNEHVAFYVYHSSRLKGNKIFFLEQILGAGDSFRRLHLNSLSRMQRLHRNLTRMKDTSQLFSTCGPSHL